MASTAPVGIGMPTRNGAAFIAQALESLLAQDHREFEIVVVRQRLDGRYRRHRPRTSRGATAGSATSGSRSRSARPRTSIGCSG